ncbi:MAG: hypothetical protein MUO67_06840, partial [Anaerolineales bacterium]|nr:hypothetical protein [Anaerolineales bacterium]
PESYILLRDIPMLPFRMLYTQVDKVAEIVSLQTPVLLIQNDCVLTVGTSILNAFDRLEVAEFSARSLIDTRSIGSLVPIGKNEIAELKVAFSLK